MDFYKDVPEKRPTEYCYSFEVNELIDILEKHIISLGYVVPKESPFLYGLDLRGPLRGPRSESDRAPEVITLTYRVMED